MRSYLGQVPTHWRVLPNRAIFGEVNDRGHPDEELLSVTITRGIVRQKTLLADSSKKDSSNQNKAAYKLVQPQDIAYNKMRAWQGAIGVSDLRGIISPAYIVMRLRDAQEPRYFHHLYRTPQFAKEAERWSYGITSDMWSLRPEHFRMIYTSLPPPDEQAAIVRFLDHASAKIERAIRAKRNLIALLNEQKQAIIQRAVTHGLDPKANLKPSGISWLGAIPEHWKVIPLKRLIRRGTTISYGIVQPGEHFEGGVPFLQTSNISKPVLRPQGLQFTTPAIASAYPRTRLETGDVILGIRASIGAAHVVPTELEGANLSRGIARIVPSNQITADYLVLFLRSRAAGEYWDYARQGSTFNEVAISAVRVLPVALPDRDSQASILQQVKALCHSPETAISQAEREIALLREYRTRLTADVATGKLDVREAAKRLSAEAEEPPPADDLAEDESPEEDAP